ncbi:MAG: ATP-binding cassette domain-containing protein [Spirochaetia bacterium]|nr:ATP-binding cassette domain-containing protein [Spirochaetia bacterium]
MIKINSLKKQFPLKKNWFGNVINWVNALNSISIDFPTNKITGIVGESGCGKSTLARVLCGIYKPDEGSFSWNEFSSDKMKKSMWKNYRRNVQMVFQDPYSSLNPRMRILDILREPLVIHKLIQSNIFKKIKKDNTKVNSEYEDKILQTINDVGLSGETLNKYPHEFSGGQRQRIAIARALILNPDVVIFDEAVSALDVSIQAQILNLIIDLQKKLNMTCLFIAHDLSVVSYVSEAIAVMYGGKIVEFNTTDKIFFSPRHPYTKLLLDSIPRAGIKNTAKNTIVDSTLFLNREGCPFYHRCSEKISKCEKNYPERTSFDEGYFYECFNPLSVEEIKKE